MKLNRQEAIRILRQYQDWRKGINVGICNEEVTGALNAAIEALGETKLIKNNEVWTDEITYDFYVTECCKIGPITTEKFCPECGKKIIR